MTRALIASARGEHEQAATEATRAVDAGALRVWRTRERTLARLVPVLAAARRDAPRADVLDPATLLADALAAAPPGASTARLRALQATLRAGDR